jgi:chromosomal replication initiation ATPase DnaA
MSKIRCPHCNQLFDPEEERQKLLEKQKQRRVRHGMMYLNWFVATHLGEQPVVVRYGKKRDRNIIKVRQISQYICYQYGHTQRAIADFFKYRRPSSIHSTINRVINDMKSDKELKETIENLLKLLNHDS